MQRSALCDKERAWWDWKSAECEQFSNEICKPQTGIARIAGYFSDNFAFKFLLNWEFFIEVA